MSSKSHKKHTRPVDFNINVFSNEDPFEDYEPTHWMVQGAYEHEYNRQGFTGRYRCVNGRMANGIHPAWDVNGIETAS